MPLSRDEIDDLKSMLKVARKRELNFGLCLENNVADSVLLLHRRKSPDVLLRRAQAIGDTTKIAMGRLRMEGKTVLLDCDINAPANCARQLRLFLREVGFAAQVKVVDPNGEQDGNLEAIVTPSKPALAATPYVKMQALWTAARTKMDAEIKRLEVAIVDTCAADPSLKPIADEAVNLHKRLDVFDGELIKRLSDLNGADDGSTLDALKAQARATVQEYETALNDPFFADLDTKNGFVSIAVTATARKTLSAIFKVLT